MVSGGQAAMPAYLFIAMIANLAFIVRACKDACGKKRPIARGPAVAILTCAISELCWVVPCFVQCFVIFVTFVIYLDPIKAGSTKTLKAGSAEIKRANDRAEQRN